MILNATTATFLKASCHSMPPSRERTWVANDSGVVSPEPRYAYFEHQGNHHRRNQHHGRAEAGGCVTVKDMNGKPIALNDPTLEDMQFTMAGPTTDYGYTSFGSDVTTPGYVARMARKELAIRAATAPTRSCTRFRPRPREPMPSAWNPSGWRTF